MTQDTNSLISTVSTYVVGGKTFTNLGEAQAHAEYLRTREVVEAYISDNGIVAPQAGALRRHLPAFSAFASAYVAGTFDLAAFDAAEKAKAEAKKAEKAASAALAPAPVDENPAS